MATPLADLLRSVLDDNTVRADAARAPREFLDGHGWPHLDAADLREAFLVLADGTPTAEASAWVAGGDAIDPDDDAAHTALSAAIGALPADDAGDELVAGDPAALDDDQAPSDHDDHDAAGEHDGAGDPAGDADDDSDDPDDPDSDIDVDVDGDIDVDVDGDMDGDVDGDDPPGAFEPFDDAAVGATSPELFAAPDDDLPTDTDAAPGEFGDGWDDLI